MKRAYVDTSALVAVHFGEPAGARVARVLRAHDMLLATAFGAAELLSALRREGRPLKEGDRLLRRLTLFSPDGSLREECEEALAVGYLRGADLWHVASALALAGLHGRKALSFCSLDDTQRSVARRLGFLVIPA